ncbi:dipeptide ABC transporter ATP-binding protein [Nocardioides sp.]|uniref:dipeptide ABC transporter ATP-binding protein n=1 Tax=Nocardioides sp. TaxID=35761 RepID=UPI0039E2BB62
MTEVTEVTELTPASPAALLDVRDLRVGTTAGVELVHGVDLRLTPGRSLGIVGESGSGKTLTAMAVAGLLPRSVRVTGGTIRIDGEDLTDRTEARRRDHLLGTFGVVFQNPTVSLNPRLTIGTQLREALPPPIRRDRGAATRRTLELLDQVGVSRPLDRVNAFPHELSGGLNQRVVIAMAIARSPRVLIADEATTALDVSVQKQVLDLIDRLRAELDLGVVIVSHDIGVVADRADDVLVLKDGHVVEADEAPRLLGAPRHAYTRELLAAVPRIDGPSPRHDGEARPVLVEARDLTRTFAAHGHDRHRIRAVDHVDLTVHAGQAVGVVGESGSGKTTLARILVGLDRPDTGRLAVFGDEVAGRTIARRRQQLRDVQYVFQDPYSALDPRQSIADIVAEPILLSGTAEQRRRRRHTVAELLDDVGLPATYAHRRPHQLSGGQRQRVVIARALALGPRVLVADEPVSALDLSVQARVLGLLARLREQRDLSYVVISHDLAVVKQLCTDVVVMRDGKVVEQGTTERIFADPHDPYTRLLLDAIPGGHWRGDPAKSHPSRKRAIL